MAVLAVSALKRFASLGISIGLLALLGSSMLARTDWQTISQTLLAINPFWLGLSVVILWLNFPLNSHRFALVVGWLTGARPSFFPTLKITWLGSFISMCAPFAALGDVARAGLVHWLMRLSRGHAAQAVLFDRGLSMLGLMLLAIAATVWQFGLPLPPYFVVTQLTLLLALTGGMIAVMLTYKFIPWPEGRVSNFIKSCCASLVAIVGHPHRLGAQMLLALCNVATYTGCMLCLARGMGIDIEATNLLLLAPLVLLVSNLPIFYMGWGGREATLLLLLKVLAPADTAATMMALSFAYGAVTMITILPGGLFFFGLQPQKKD